MANHVWVVETFKGGRWVAAHDWPAGNIPEAYSSRAEARREAAYRRASALRERTRIRRYVSDGKKQ